MHGSEGGESGSTGLPYPYLACLAASGVAQETGYTTVKEESSVGGPTGDFISNGVITPIDQKMQTFYIRNADGAIEVRLTDDAVIGLQTRIQTGGFDARMVEFRIGEQELGERTSHSALTP